MPGKNDEDDSNAYGMTYYKQHRVVSAVDASPDVVSEFLDFTGKRHGYDNKMSLVGVPSGVPGGDLEVTIYSRMPTIGSQISSIDALWVIEQLGVIKANSRVFFSNLPAGLIKVVVTTMPTGGDWTIHISEPML